MANQTIAKPLGLIKDLKILIHGIPYAVTFIVIQSSVLDFSYFMLLGRPWLRDGKMFHDWGNNINTIQGNDIVRTVHVTKKLGAPTKHLKVLVCYDFHYRIPDKRGFDVCHRTMTVFNRNHSCSYIILVKSTC
jgi:hypothetical protein